jgi:hypothetical protein
MFTDHTSHKVLPKLHKLKTLKTSFGPFIEQQLKMYIYHDLEVFKINFYDLKAASIIIENSGGCLKKILFEPYYFDEYVDNFIEDFLIFIRSIHKNCLSSEHLSHIFSASNEHFTELENLLKT